MGRTPGFRAVWIAALLGLLSSACAPHAPSKNAATAESTGTQNAAQRHGPLSQLRAKAFRYRFAIYTSQPPVDLPAALADAAKKHGLSVTTLAPEPTLPPLASSISVVQPPIEKFAPPSLDTLEYFSKGLDAQQQQRLTASRSVAVFEVVGPIESAFDDYRAALLLGRELAQRLGGLLWDEETRVAYSLASFQPRIDSWQGTLPFINRHVVLHEYRDGELLRLVSIGMVKFGLPDVVVNDVAGSDAERVAKLIDLVLQRLVEGAAPDQQGLLRAALDEVTHAEARQWLSEDVAENAQRSVVVTLAQTAPEAGDAENRLLEIQFPGDKAHLQERQAAAVNALFGSDDSIVYLKHDAALLAASARARQKAMVLRERFADGPKLGEQLLVKSPFAADGGEEWMWVEVVKWQGNTISGILTDDAFNIPGLKAGGRVEVKASEIFDYLLIKRDGSREGNETEALLEARASKRQKK